MSDTVLDDAVVVKSPEDVDRLLGRMNELNGEIAHTYALRDATFALISARWSDIIDPKEQEIEAIREAIGVYVSKRRPSWIRRFSRTAKLQNGTIKWRIIPTSLETPQDNKAIVNALRSMHGGKRYLQVTYTLDRKALAKANSGLLAKLRHLGVWVGRHESLIVQANSEAKPTTVRNRRYRSLT